MRLKRSMDIFGEALLGYMKGDRSSFYLKDEKGKRHIYDLADRFRPYSSLNKSEKKIISLSRGNILDVGCGTGNVIPPLEKKGKVLGIDISPIVIEVAQTRGHKNCIVADIFTFRPKQKFDTITLFGNDLGIGGSVSGTKKLLKILREMLKRDGQILAILRNYNDSDYRLMKLTPIWKNRSGPKFNWILLNTDFVSELCKEQKLESKVIAESWKYKVVKITK